MSRSIGWSLGLVAYVGLCFACMQWHLEVPGADVGAGAPTGFSFSALWIAVGVIMLVSALVAYHVRSSRVLTRADVLRDEIVDLRSKI